MHTHVSKSKNDKKKKKRTTGTSDQLVTEKIFPSSSAAIPSSYRPPFPFPRTR
jgi:hypothetical protein